ncbi:MAG: hypothetical protein QOG04_1656 [Actinomycetota bacterium]|jgi:hypothetical protein|nr:hypothetical protein [Actinomycetota bacterium]
MRVRLPIAVIACVIGLAPVSMGGPRADHSETQAYLLPTGVTTSHEDSLPTTPTKSVGPALEFHPTAADRYVTFTANDLTGRTVILEIHQDADGGEDPLQGYMCANVMPAAYELVSDNVVTVRVLHGLCGNHNWGWTTQGTVTATFSGTNPGHLSRGGQHHH